MCSALTPKGSQSLLSSPFLGCRYEVGYHPPFTVRMYRCNDGPNQVSHFWLTGNPSRRRIPPSTLLPSNSSTTSSNRTFGLQDAQDLVSSDDADLGDAVGVTEGNTNLRGSGTLTGELADLVDDLGGSGLQPCWRVAAVGEGRGRDTLSLSLGLNATHGDGKLVVSELSWSKFRRSTLRSSAIASEFAVWAPSRQDLLPALRAC